MRSFDTAMLLLRAATGVVFLAHGVRHLLGRERVIAWLSSIGFRAPGLQWVLMAFGEIAAGVGFGFGLLTAVTAAAIMAIVTVAFLTVHLRAGFFVTARPDEGYEYVGMLAVVAVAVAIAGPGAWSLDGALGIDLSGAAGAAIAALGILAAVGQLAVFYRRPVS